MTLLQNIQHLAGNAQSELIRLRRHLHAWPELSFQEHQTARFIADTLQSLGIEHSTGWGGTGIVAVIRGQNPDSRTIALRADMDALPITEANEAPYCSQNKGIMHACGHDVHTTCLLGAAHILQELRTQWQGTARLIFQPGEELLPGGASLLIKEGVLENPRPEGIIGTHEHPKAP